MASIFKFQASSTGHSQYEFVQQLISALPKHINTVLITVCTLSIDTPGCECASDNGGLFLCNHRMLARHN